MALVTFLLFGFLVVAWFQPALCGAHFSRLFALLVQGMRHFAAGVQRTSRGNGLREQWCFAVMLAPFIRTARIWGVTHLQVSNFAR